MFRYSLVPLLILSRCAVAQPIPDSTATDSLRSYELAEIVTLGERPVQREVGTLRALPFAALQASDAPTAAEAIRLLPSTHVTTNSRGETLVYVRGTDARNTPIYLDGALVTPPWDQRLDLRMLPAGLLGGLRILTGTPTLLYGGGGYGGVVDLLSRTRRSEGRTTEVEVAGGYPGAVRGTGAFSLRHQGWHADLAATYDRQDGDALPAGADLGFSQPSADLRTNTDYRLGSLLARVGRDWGAPGRVAVSVLHLDAAKGVAPEGHVDPALEPVRFWRYPDWTYDLLIAAGETRWGRVQWRGAVWGGRLAQTIRQFASAAYAEVVAEERGEDLTAGARIVGATALGPGSLRLAMTGLYATHDVTESDGVSETHDAGEHRRFRHAQLSSGLTWSGPIATRWTLDAGLSSDLFEPLETGPLPSRPGEKALGGSLGLTRDASEALTLRAGVSTRTRFPTMRQLFDGALGRYVVNPALAPERAWQAETAARIDGALGWGEVIAYARAVEGTIQQEVLENGQRRRVNLGGSRAYGVEAVAEVRPMRSVWIDGFLTFLHVRAFTEADSGLYLDEIPAAVGRLAVRYAPARGFGAHLAARYTGTAYSPGADGPARLDRSVLADVRVHYRWSRAQSVVEVFGRVDNLFDAVALPQLGLPAPGRTIRAGVKVTLDR